MKEKISSESELLICLIDTSIIILKFKTSNDNLSNIRIYLMHNSFLLEATIPHLPLQKFSFYFLLNNANVSSFIFICYSEFNRLLYVINQIIL